MQYAKDTFYLALRERLATINPERTISLNGKTRPAVLVVENELPSAALPLPNAFHLHWGAVRTVQPARRPLMALECVIRYAAAGSGEAVLDRGRTLAALDVELLQMCAPPRAAKLDRSVAPPAALGTMIFWNTPEFTDPEMPLISAGNVGRTARLSIFFFPEVDLA